MKTHRLILVALAAGAVMAGTARAQDKSASHQGESTNFTAQPSFSMNLKMAPAIQWGPNLPVTGLLVDFLKPEQTWNLFNPLIPPPVAIQPAITVPPPVSAQPNHMNDDLADHEANFVFLKLSFP